MPRIGEMDTLLTLEQPSDTVDGSGNVTPNWTQLGTAWAKMELLGGGDQDPSLRAQVNYRVTIYNRPDLTIKPSWRVGISGTSRKLELTSPPSDPDGKHQWLTFTVKEFIAGA